MQRPTWPRELNWWAAVLAELSSAAERASARRTVAVPLPTAFALGLAAAPQEHFATSLARGSRLELWPASVMKGIGARSGTRFDVPRLAWWPTGACGEPLAGLASSRLPRALDTLPEFFRTLQAALGEVLANNERLVIVESTAASDLMLRAAAVGEVPVLRIVVAPDRTTLAAWFRKVPLGPAPSTRPGECRLYLSPPLDGYEPPPPLANLPVPDRVLLTAVERLDVLFLRRGGVWHELLRQVSEVEPAAAPVVRVAPHPTLVRPQLLRDIVPRYAVSWAPAPLSARNVAPGNSAPAATLGSNGPSATRHESDETTGQTVPATVLAGTTDDFLIHFTRRCDGPWPGQSWEEYWDELLQERSERDRSPLAVLSRILREERLLASHQGIRGRFNVVCFSAVPLFQLGGRRVWRRHRRRWDFEPFGLAIRRAVLESRGARPVFYGDETAWAKLPVAERPFFQKFDVDSRDESRVGTSAPERVAPSAARDWRVEREWRIVGDVALADIATSDALTFVPDERAARDVARISRFPVIILSDS